MTHSKRDAQHQPCPKCGKKQWGIRKLVNQGGTTMYPYVCEACGIQTQHYAKKTLVKALGIEPAEVQPRFPRHKCEVCGASGAQNHHWAPFFLFGEDAHRWPTSYLCPSCHARWHELVTPQMAASDA
jgi:predicted RNA-binding Zn-ribbon protein involved in translation (DUF1610 family)